MLRITTTSEADFVSPGVPVGEPPSANDTIAPPRRDWRFWLRTGVSVFFVAAWVDAMAFHYFSGATYRNGSPSPTASKTEPLDNHGRVVYVTPSEKALVDRLKAGMTIGIPAALLLIVLVQYVFKIDLYPKEPNRRGAPNRVLKNSRSAKACYPPPSPGGNKRECAARIVSRSPRIADPHRLPSRP